jgi:alanine dehydrogenase
MQQLTLGVMAHSRKENERRLPIHPGHLERIAPGLRAQIYLEHGYGERFGVLDEELRGLVAGLRSRAELIETCDVVLLPKPQAEDLAELREGQVLWGWPHCVQDRRLTQAAIDSRLTLIAWEAMNHWTDDGSFNLHVFHKNNELAGYCSVIHALELAGSTGDYGRRLRAAVVGFGATARGGVAALNAHGVHDIDIVTNRRVTAVSAPIHSARIVHLDRGDDQGESAVVVDSVRQPLAGFLAAHDIIVNCVLQNTAAPLTFLGEDDLPALRRGTLVVDVACDEGMGFAWARPTSFDEPTFPIGDGASYYGVDHSPSHLWNSATWEISEALLPYLPIVLGGPDAWSADETIRRAIEIRDGVVVNPDILDFQGRVAEYPHAATRAGRGLGPAA